MIRPHGLSVSSVKTANEEIKLEIFADDFTSFLRDGASLNALLGTIKCFTLYSGLKINYDETEVMLLGNQKLNPATLATCSGKEITIKKAVKILGVYFTYNQFLWRRLNFEETALKSISEKLRFWNWRNLTILGRI